MPADWEKRLSKELQEYIEAERNAAEARGYARAKAERACVTIGVETAKSRGIATHPPTLATDPVTKTDKRMARLSRPDFVPSGPRGRNAVAVEELLKSISPNGATATALQHKALHEKELRIASSSMRHALDQLEAKGIAWRKGVEWFYKRLE